LSSPSCSPFDPPVGENSLTPPRQFLTGRVLRLRMIFALLSSLLAQDDNQLRVSIAATAVLRAKPFAVGSPVPALRNVREGRGTHSRDGFGNSQGSEEWRQRVIESVCHVSQIRPVTSATLRGRHSWCCMRQQIPRANFALRNINCGASRYSSRERTEQCYFGCRSSFVSTRAAGRLRDFIDLAKSPRETP